MSSVAPTSYPIGPNAVTARAPERRVRELGFDLAFAPKMT